MRLRAGLGVSYHLANKVAGTEDASGITATARDALGFVSQVDYLFGHKNNLAIGLRFEKVSYEISSQSTRASGDNLGIQFSYFWKSDQ